MWEKEIRIVNGLGKLYPRFRTNWGLSLTFKLWDGNFQQKAWWVGCLCRHQLGQRLPNLEKFIKYNDFRAWCVYKTQFGLRNNQCGKKN